MACRAGKNMRHAFKKFWYAHTEQARFLAPCFHFLKVVSSPHFLKSRLKKHFRFLLIKLEVTPKVVLKSKPKPLLNLHLFMLCTT